MDYDGDPHEEEMSERADTARATTTKAEAGQRQLKLKVIVGHDRKKWKKLDRVHRRKQQRGESKLKLLESVGWEGTHRKLERRLAERIATHSEE